MQSETPLPTAVQTTSTPSPISPDSSTTFANDPLLALLSKPLVKMSQDEIRAQVNSLRLLRVNGQKLGQALREGAAREAAKPAPRKEQGLDDVLKGLGL